MAPWIEFLQTTKRNVFPRESWSTHATIARWLRWPATEAPCGAVVREPGRAWPFGRTTIEALTSARRAGEPAEAMDVANTLDQRWPRPDRDASRGELRAIRLRARSTGPRSALHLRQRTCRCLSAPTGRRAHFFVAEARPTERLDGRLCCLSSQSKTRARTTQSRTRPASDTPCQVVPKPGQSWACAPDAR